jgi:hypothetical protein
MEDKMDYWEECIAEALEAEGVSATPEQIRNIAGWVEGAHENYGMAYGHDCIPNPLSADVSELKRQLAKIEDTHERQLHGIKAGVAQRRGVDITDVTIEDDGHVTYRL